MADALYQGMASEVISKLNAQRVQKGLGTVTENEQAMKIVLGHCETLCAYNTYQFSDYSRYECGMFDEKVKAEHKEKVFPEDLKKAYELGKRLTEMAKA